MGYVFDLPGEADTYETIAPADTSTGITQSVRVNPADGILPGANAIAALLTVEANTVTVRMDGGDPTATAGTDLGHELAAGDSMVLRGPNTIKNFRCIDTVSGSAGKVKVTCFF